jgi:putative endonuclease
MYYTYIIYSPSSDIHYVGYSNDYQRRLNEHNEQDYFNTFTSKHRPWLLKAAFQCGDSEKEAIRIERFIKKQKSKLFIQLKGPLKGAPFFMLQSELITKIKRLLIRLLKTATKYTKLNVCI